MKDPELKLFWLIFIGASLDSKVENQNYLKINYIKGLLSSVEGKKREELLKDIKSFQKELKWSECNNQYENKCNCAVLDMDASVGWPALQLYQISL